MELAIAFIAAWIMRRAVDDKVDEFENSNTEVRNQVNARFPNMPEGRRARMVRNAARRNTIGFGLYQLRHGWPSLRYSVSEGWREAKEEHKQWLESREDAGDETTGKPGFFSRVKAAARAGWDRAKEAANIRRAEKANEESTAVAPAESANPESDKEVEAKPTSPMNTDSKPPDTPNNQSTPYEIKPVAAPAAGNGGSFMAETGETTGFESARQYAQRSQQNLAAAVSAAEQAEAALIAGGLGKDPAVMGALAQASEHLANAQAAFAGLLAGLNSHQDGREYAQSKGAAAASTQFLGAE